jgi:hypothetical protein
MQALILNMFKYSDATLNPDSSGGLLFFSHCEAFTHEGHLIIINIISILTEL